MKKIFIFAIAFFIMTACNEYIVYDGPDFFYLDTGNIQTSSTLIQDDASITGTNAAEYYVHFCTRRRTDPVELYYTVTCSSGLKEGVDYGLEANAGTLTFYPGSNFDRPIRMEFYPHDLEKNERITITLTGCSDSSVSLGRPGPDALGMSLIITKYKH